MFSEVRLKSQTTTGRFSVLRMRFKCLMRKAASFLKVMGQRGFLAAFLSVGCLKWLGDLLSERIV